MDARVVKLTPFFEWNKQGLGKGLATLKVLAIEAFTSCAAVDATLKAFAILFQACTLFAVASLPVTGTVAAYFGLKCIWITLHRNGNGLASERLFGKCVVAVLALAIGHAVASSREAFTIQLQAA